MAKWEYCKLTWWMDAESAAKGTVQFTDPSRSELQITTSFLETVGELGIDGWEMVNFVENARPLMHEVYLFKRPIETAPPQPGKTGVINYARQQRRRK